MAKQNNSQMQPIAVVLLSGGMDSTVCVAEALARGYEVAALHLNYGQRTERREEQAFRDIVEHYNIAKSLSVNVSHLAAIGGSSLTDTSMAVPEANLHAHTAPTTYVPFRNANILSIAASWAEVLQAKTLYIGAVEEDGSGYPDCRRSFFDAFEETIRLGTKPGNEVKILTPIIHLQKSDIVKKGIELNAPLHLTWSCYSNSDVACGVCDSCALRLRGFALAGVEDPIPYSVRPNYL